MNETSICGSVRREDPGGNVAELSVVGPDGPTMEFAEKGWARALKDCDSGDQRPTKGQRPDRPVGSRNLCSRRCGQAVEARDDEIKDLLRFDPMVGIDWLGIAPDQQEPEQVDWRSPSLGAALGEIVEQTLSMSGVLPRGKRSRIVSRSRRRSPAPSPAGAIRKRGRLCAKRGASCAGSATQCRTLVVELRSLDRFGSRRRL